MKQIIYMTFFIAFAMLVSNAVYAGDIAEKIDTCLGCHGVPSYTTVYPSYPVPKLAGQHKQYLISALQAYRAGKRTHSTMQLQAQTLTKEEIGDVAAYFAGLESAPAHKEVVIPGNLIAKVTTCAACHTSDGNSIVPTFPKIAGQHEEYIYRTLLDYKSGKRSNPIMLAIVGTLSDQDMKNLAAYFSKQPGLGTISITKRVQKK